MRDKVEIQRPTKVDDGGGGFEQGWETVASIYARVLKVSANTEFFARTVDYRITHQVGTRHSETTRQMERGYRIIFTDEVGERFLFVESVRDLDNKRRWTVIDCSEDERDRQ
jgi:SPP1 family predicted phage head-tail adaptor